MAQLSIKDVQRKKVRGNFVEDTKAELKKVTWPDRKTVVSSSIVIVFIVAFSTLFVTGVDYGLSKVANFWLKL